MILSFLCSNVSGAPLPSIPLSNFTVDFKSGSESISGYVSSLSNSTSGFYSVTVSDSLPIGSYRISILNPSVYISPDFYSVQKTDNYNIDDVYSLVFSNSVSPVVLSSSERFATASVQHVDGDDFVEDFVVPSRYLPLTSYSAFSVGSYLFNPTTQTYSVISGGVNTVSVTSETLGIIRVIMDNTLTDLIDYSGAQTTAQVVSQVQCLTPDGYKKTLLEININISRDFNKT
jgi:hypothetical protein